jgi:hypothetical protein
MMKYIKIITLFILTIVSVNCSDDFLDKSPLDTINTKNYPANENELITLVNGAYQPLQRPKLYNFRLWTFDIMAGNSIVGAGGGSDGIETQDMSNFVTATDNAGVLDLWRGPWPGILMANKVIDVAPQLDIDEDIKNRSLGEAYFLRAHYYFILVRFFGDIPLITEPGSSDTDLMPERVSKDLIYSQIISDLEIAASLLPLKSSYGSSDIGRANKGAALGILAKVNLTIGDYSRVVELTSQVETLGYALNSDYSANFNPDSENSNESIFEIQFASDGGFGFWSDENQASWASTFMGPRGSGMVSGGWGWNQPTQEFIDDYEQNDKRKDVSVFYKGSPNFYGIDYSKSYSLTGYNVRKFLVPIEVSSSYDNSPLNFPVLRFSDVLLMKSEALNELGSTSEAEIPLNKVRNRAGLGNISTNLDQASFREAVLKERRIELAFEGQRWYDLIRVNEGLYGLNFLHSIGKTNATQKHLLFPIPLVEIDRNPNLTQNPGY